MCVYIHIEFAGCPSGLGVNEVTHDEGDLQIFVDLLFMNRHIDWLACHPSFHPIGPSVHPSQLVLCLAHNTCKASRNELA